MFCRSSGDTGWRLTHFRREQRVETRSSARNSGRSDGPDFIEVKFKPMDTPKGMPVFGKMAREYDYGNWALAQ